MKIPKSLILLVSLVGAFAVVIFLLQISKDSVGRVFGESLRGLGIDSQSTPIMQANMERASGIPVVLRLYDCLTHPVDYLFGLGRASLGERSRIHVRSYIWDNQEYFITIFSYNDKAWRVFVELRGLGTRE